MFALLASLVVVAYLVVPGVLFKAVFSLFVPLRAFDRTRTQEFGYSAVVCAIPFVMAVFLVWNSCLGRWPLAFPDTWSQRTADYKIVLLASFAEPFADSKDHVWDAAARSAKRQGRVLFWYLIFVGVEAAALGFTASRWGAWQPKLSAWPRTERLLTRFLLAHVSEWHVLLTNFLFPGTTIHADVLTAEDRLYQGEVLNYTRDHDGSLTGIYLNNAQRYDRAGLLEDRKNANAKANADYWKPIPGSRLFIFADKIFTLNIRPQTTLAAASEVARTLDPGAVVRVEPVATNQPTPPPENTSPAPATKT